MYHHHTSASRRGGRRPLPGAGHPAQPSDAAAKAAAAAKVLHRRAQERAAQDKPRQQQHQHQQYQEQHQQHHHHQQQQQSRPGSTQQQQHQQQHAPRQQQQMTAEDGRILLPQQQPEAVKEVDDGEVVVVVSKEQQQQQQPPSYYPPPHHPHHPPHHPHHAGPHHAYYPHPPHGTPGAHPPNHHHPGPYYGYHPHHPGQPQPPPQPAQPTHTHLSAPRTRRRRPNPAASAEDGEGGRDDGSTTTARPSRERSSEERPRRPVPVRPSSATRRVIGGHVPIHVPRAVRNAAASVTSVRATEEEEEEEEEEDEPLPYYRHPKNKGRGSVFRSQNNKNEGVCVRHNNNEGKEDTAGERDIRLSESSAHEILLSLSKSFEGGARFAGPGGDGARVSGLNDDRPKSPEGPPLIQHWHKQSPTNSFEPQPSPIKLSASIDLSSSFTLFSQSFDANLEGLLGPAASFGLGPAASFGLGPMRSLSFGFGLGGGTGGGEDTQEDGPRVIGQSNTEKTSELVVSDGGMKERIDDHPAPVHPEPVRSERTSSHINVSGNKAGNSSVTVLINARRVASPVVANRECAYAQAEEAGSAQHRISIRPRGNVDIGYSGNDRHPVSTHNHPAESVRKSNHRADEPVGQQQHHLLRKMERRLFGAMERHSAVFDNFHFLLPGARAIFARDPARHRVQFPAEGEEEVARRRVDSALCAFGGTAVGALEDDDAYNPKVKRRRVDVDAQRYYDESMAGRYFEDEDRLSWEVEEDPPIRISDSDEDDDIDSRERIMPYERSMSNDDDDEFHGRSTLQRNIGVMVYPAVNAFTAIEPGIITPALSEMNSNSVDNKKKCPTDATPGKSQSESSHEGGNGFLPMVSPEFSRPLAQKIVSISSPAEGEETPQRSSVNYAGGAWMSNRKSTPRKVSPSGSKDAENPSTADLLFVDMQELHPEQYRIVAPKKRHESSSGRYRYPPLPLPYAQRKRISNAMFAMSKSISGLTEECASVLGEARKKDAWDLAVAQLMTQVIVVTHCSVEDSRLDGLSKYLLTLGIAC